MTDWPALVDRIQDVLHKGSLGEPATYTPLSGSPAQIRVIFSGDYVRVDVESGVAIESRRLAVGVRLSDLAAPPQAGDQVTLRGTTYVVRNVEPDQEGEANLVLGVA